MGFKPGSDTIGMKLGKNILTEAIRMENEPGGRRALGKASERFVMTEA